MDRNVLIAASVLLSFLLGAAVMWGYSQQNDFEPGAGEIFLDDVFDERFFSRSRSPFEEMSRIQEEIDEMFNRHDRKLGFNRWFSDRYGDFPVSGITSREDGGYLYYVLDVEGKTVANVKVRTQDGYVTIEAELNENSDGFNSTTSLNQRFPIPSGVNESSAEVLHEEGEILIRFEKHDL